MAVSFGDIAAAAEMLYKIYEFCKNAKDADNTFRKLMEEILRLAKVLSSFEKEACHLIQESIPWAEQQELIVLVTSQTEGLREAVKLLTTKLELFQTMGNLTARLKFAHNKVFLEGLRAQLGNYCEHVFIVSKTLNMRVLRTQNRKLDEIHYLVQCSQSNIDARIETFLQLKNQSSPVYRSKQLRDSQLLFQDDYPAISALQGGLGDGFGAYNEASSQSRNLDSEKQETTHLSKRNLDPEVKRRLKAHAAKCSRNFPQYLDWDRVLDISKFWLCEAIRDIEVVNCSREKAAEVMLNLIKSAWILYLLRRDHSGKQKRSKSEEDLIDCLTKVSKALGYHYVYRIDIQDIDDAFDEFYDHFKVGRDSYSLPSDPDLLEYGNFEIQIPGTFAQTLKQNLMDFPSQADRLYESHYASDYYHNPPSVSSNTDAGSLFAIPGPHRDRGCSEDSDRLRDEHDHAPCEPWIPEIGNLQISPHQTFYQKPHLFSDAQYQVSPLDTSMLESFSSPMNRSAPTPKSSKAKIHETSPSSISTSSNLRGIPSTAPSSDLPSLRRGSGSDGEEFSRLNEIELQNSCVPQGEISNGYSCQSNTSTSSESESTIHVYQNKLDSNKIRIVSMYKDGEFSVKEIDRKVSRLNISRDRESLYIRLKQHGNLLERYRFSYDNMLYFCGLQAALFGETFIHDFANTISMINISRFDKESGEYVIETWRNPHLQMWYDDGNSDNDSSVIGAGRHLSCGSLSSTSEGSSRGSVGSCDQSPISPTTNHNILDEKIPITRLLIQNSDYDKPELYNLLITEDTYIKQPVGQNALIIRPNQQSGIFDRFKKRKSHLQVQRIPDFESNNGLTGLPIEFPRKNRGMGLKDQSTFTKVLYLEIFFDSERPEHQGFFYQQFKSELDRRAKNILDYRKRLESIRQPNIKVRKDSRDS